VLVAYKCNDCSYQGQRFSGGRCPACGSADIARVNAQKEQGEKPPSRISLLFCLVLWFALAGLIIQKII
jgi:predicted RNA-binding Zn-ribbon protein involved in translation (DUF1610 family)